MKRTAVSAAVLRIVARQDEAAPPHPRRGAYMDRALHARIEDLPRLLRSFEKEAAKAPGDADLSEAIIHLGEVTRALAAGRVGTEEAPRARGRPRLVAIGLAAGLVTVAASLFALGRVGPAPVLEASDAPAVAAAPRNAPEIELSRGESVAANATKMLAKFPREVAADAADGACADSNQVTFASRALAKRIAAPLLDAGGGGEASASDWNSLIFIARLLRHAEHAQTAARAAGCFGGAAREGAAAT